MNGHLAMGTMFARCVMPNSFVIRDALFRGIGKARAAGLVGREALLDAALSELSAWSNANGITIDMDESRRALEAKAGVIAPTFGLSRYLHERICRKVSRPWSALRSRGTVRQRRGGWTARG